MPSLQPRATPSRLMSYLSPLLAVLLTTICGAILFALLGKNPIAGLAVFFWEPIRNLRGWTEIGVKCTPLILCALGYAMCYRSAVMSIRQTGAFSIIVVREPPRVCARSHIVVNARSARSMPASGSKTAVLSSGTPANAGMTTRSSRPDISRCGQSIDSSEAATLGT